MPSSNSLQMFTLMLMLTMSCLNLCMANPVNKEDELVTNKDLPIKLKERLFNMTSKKSEVPETDRVMVDDVGKPVDTTKGTVILEEEESKKKASWETAKYIHVMLSLSFA